MAVLEMVSMIINIVFSTTLYIVMIQFFYKEYRSSRQQKDK